MGYYAKDGSYVRDASDYSLPNQSYGDAVRTTGAPSYDERVRDSEMQHNIGETIRSTGGPSFDERVRDSEAQRNLNRFGAPIKTTGGPGFQERMSDSEMIAAESRRRDQDKTILLNSLMTNLPENSDELKLALEGLDLRLDFMKKLVDNYYWKFMRTCNEYKSDFSEEASAEINQSLATLLNLVETLKSCGYNFGSDINSYKSGGYDPYKPDINLNDVQSMMFRRKRNGANVQIGSPKDYYQDENQPTYDAVDMVNCVNKHLENYQNMDYLWEKYCASAMSQDMGQSR
jgi:hypothetical protein